MNSLPGADLPYRDTKAVGAADFYYGINATFRFILSRLGAAGWRRYLEQLGRGYFTPVNRRWQEGGLRAVADYWRAFFAAEPGAVVEVSQLPDRVEVHVRQCPAIKHLRAGGREIVREYCQHCYHLGNARAEAAGMTMRLEGGNGLCRHTFFSAGNVPAAQDLARIKEATA
ncbi:MAG: hypothetical protein EXS38_11380 [Opitutus sp.]|nr:hypothetical protein [Opitutus sp.]